MPCHLFLLVPPGSGSTALWRLLSTSPSVTTFGSDDGHGIATTEDDAPDDPRWDPNAEIDWDALRTEWEGLWDAESPVRLEKSSSHIVHAHTLAKHFDDARFVAMVRDPYAVCEGQKRRWTPDLDYARIAQDCIARMRHQIDNESLDRVVSLTYEDLCANTQMSVERIITLVPELDTPVCDGQVTVYERRAPIIDMNPRQWMSMSGPDVEELNGVFADHADVLEHFGYEVRSHAELLSEAQHRMMMMLMDD